jgi:hypothetical protein
MFNKNCPFRKRKGECYHQVKREIRRYDMPKWNKRAINHVYYTKVTELCKGKVVTTHIQQVHVVNTLAPVTSNYRNILRHDWYKIAG